MLENSLEATPIAAKIFPTAAEATDIVAQSHRRIRKRPAWMYDYEVTGIDQSKDPLTHFALFSDCDPTTFESAVKDAKWQ